MTAVVLRSPVPSLHRLGSESRRQLPRFALERHASVHWELMFTRSLFETADMDEQGKLLNEVARLIDAGTLHTTFAESFGRINAANLKRPHALIESGPKQDHAGRIRGVNSSNGARLMRALSVYDPRPPTGMSAMTVRIGDIADELWALRVRRCGSQ